MRDPKVDEEKKEEPGDEPRHGCCTRFVLFFLAIGGVALCIPTSLFWLGMFACLACAKCCVYHCCCDDYGRIFMEALVWTPCRWLRISCTGKRYIWPSDSAKSVWAKQELDKVPRPPVVRAQVV